MRSKSTGSGLCRGRAGSVPSARGLLVLVARRQKWLNIFQVRTVGNKMLSSCRFLMLLGVACFCLSSCAVGPADWSGPGAVYGPRYYNGYGGYPAYSGYPAGVGSRPYYGRARYYSSRCHSCGHYPCRCRHRSSSHDHQRHHDRGEDPGKREYRIIAGDLEGKKKPENFHSLDWYHERGYSLKDLKIETEKGKTVDRRPSSKKKKKKKK